MKTEHEIEQMKIDIQNKMKEVRVGCFKAWDEGKVILSKELHEECVVEWIAEQIYLDKEKDCE